MQRASLWLLMLLIVTGAPTLSMAAAPDLSGYWDLPIDGRKVPAAELLAAITPARLAERARADQQEIRACVLRGLPYLMDAGRPLNIEQGLHVILLYSEAPVAPRYIYLDRTTHIDAADYDPSTNGDSIGHWEADTLVVDTVGFAATHGITTLPGGGYRTASAHLVERFRLLEGGTVLSVVSTWSDPAVFRTPHSYEYRYERLPRGYQPAPKDPCNAFDPVRDHFLDEPAVGP